jgi:hypothetical protein
MAITSDRISFSKINTELGRIGTARFDFDDAEARKLASAGNTGQSLTTRTPVKLSNFSGHARAKIVVNSTRTNILALADAQAIGYAAGKTWVSYDINSVDSSNNPVVIGSTSTSSPSMIVSGFTSGDIVEITNNGIITGAGGQGGQGGGGYPSSGHSDRGQSTSGQGQNGYPGGDALLVSYPVSFTNYGSVWGGGGGGGSGGGSNDGSKNAAPIGAPGAGGGAGYIVGAGGLGGTNTNGNNGASGNPGTLTAGGAISYGGGAAYNFSAAGGNPGESGGNSSGSSGTTYGGISGKYLDGQSYVNDGNGISGTVLGRVS